MKEEISAFILPIVATLIDAAEVIQANKSRCAVIVDQDKVIGVLSEGDILRALLSGADILSPIEAFVRHGFKFLHSVDFVAALRLVKAHGVSLVPVLDSDFRLKAVITSHDILACVDPQALRPGK